MQADASGQVRCCRKVILPLAFVILSSLAIAHSSRAEAVPSSTPHSLKGHWSFQPVRRPTVPDVSRLTPHASRNPIDAFVASELAEQGLSAVPEADRQTLIRRLSFDLIGLPPEPEEVEQFIADLKSDAYETLVERFLASPHYGERWARHWLDVAGFAESSMFIGDAVRPGFWRYRDYVIRAFNADKPYNQFVTEQLAGDELFDWRSAHTFTPEQIDTLAATGFLRCPPDATDNQLITQFEKVYATQQAAMEVSMKALMGLTMNCVRCHSHKYDPISQDEYYKLIAIFQPAYDPENWLAGIWSAGNPGPIRAIPVLDRPGREEYERRTRNWQAERHNLNEQINGGLLRSWRDRHMKARAEEIRDDAARAKLMSLLSKASAERTPDDEKFIDSQVEALGATQTALEKAYPGFAGALAAARTRIEAIRKENANLPPLIWATFDVSTNPSPARLLHRGDYEQPAHSVEPGVLRALGPSGDPFHVAKVPHSRTSGGRLALARWLTNREHPLTARVMVNRLWQYHFGMGLVATPDDFGERGARPTHPELLDWLAAEFMDNGWSIKHIHRLILNSATWRQTSFIAATVRREADANLASDDTTAAHASTGAAAAGFPSRRLEAEAIRDALLEVAGLLDRQLFGESLPTQRLPDGRTDISTNSTTRLRRSIYISTRRTTVPTLLTAFDAPSMDTNWPKRNDSVIPQQALALMNSSFALECSEHFARRVLREGGPIFEKRLGRAFALAYARQPEPDEVALFKKFGESHGNAAISSGGDKPLTLESWTAICHALLSSNEFLYVD